MFPTKILLATDGSEDAALAARTAADLSVSASSELHIVHVLDALLRYAYPGVTSEVFSYVFDEMYQEAHDLLDQQAQLMRDGGAKVAGSHLETGSPVDEILDLAEKIEADLVVVGSRGVGPIARLTLGSTSEGIVHHATRPVLVARGGEHAWPPTRIVIAHDDSEDAQKAGRLAASIGELYGAKGMLVRAYPPFRQKASREGRAVQLDAFYDVLLEGEMNLKGRAGELEEILGSHLRIRVLEGNAATVIVREADRAGGRTLVAVGSRGLGPVKRMRLGSVSTKVLRTAPGPVLVYPHSRT